MKNFGTNKINLNPINVFLGCCQLIKKQDFKKNQIKYCLELIQLYKNILKLIKNVYH